MCTQPTVASSVTQIAIFDVVAFRALVVVVIHVAPRFYRMSRIDSHNCGLSWRKIAGLREATKRVILRLVRCNTLAAFLSRRSAKTRDRLAVVAYRI